MGSQSQNLVKETRRIPRNYVGLRFERSYIIIMLIRRVGRDKSVLVAIITHDLLWQAGYKNTCTCLF